MDEGIGYNADIQKVPNVVTLSPKNLTGKYDYTTHTFTLTWTDPNGDMLDSIFVQRSVVGGGAFQNIARIPLADASSKDGASYSYIDTPEVGTDYYRICVYAAGKSTVKYSNTIKVSVVDSETQWIDISDSVMVNPGFDIQTSWTTGNVGKGAANHRAVEGWETTSTDGNGCAAAFGIGSGMSLNGGRCPYVNAEGNVSGGALGINQGWSQKNNYTQAVTLPAGTYRLSYAVWNSSYPGRKFTNLCGYSIGTTTYTDNLTAIDTCQWVESTMTPFKLYAKLKITVTVGYQSTGGTSITNPYLFFDYVRIEKAVDKGSQETSGITTTYNGDDGKASPVAYYTLDGRRTDEVGPGIVIAKYSDGKRRKVRLH